MRLLLLNQYFPPDPAPTGLLLGELAERLRADGHSVAFVDAGTPYRAGQQPRGRARRELSALARMLWRGLRAPRADLVISATSPPLLLVVATLVALRHRARSIHWAMDLYPELAVALGEIPNGVVARVCGAIMSWCYRHTNTVVALDGDMAAHLRERYGVSAEICGPWVFAPVAARLEEANAVAPSEPWTWVYSGNLGRAHEWATLLEAQRIVESRDDRIRLLFQGGGPAWPAAQARASELGLRRCDWRGYVDEADLPSSLLRNAVCVATQRPEAQGLLWPSKLGLLLALPRPILWIGQTNSAIAQRLRELPGAGVFEPGDAAAVAEWLLATRSKAAPAAQAEKAGEIRAASLEWWSRRI
jgi:glycosyltransferase involved in cell wall biosynthesis